MALFSLVNLGILGAFLSIASSKYSNNHPEIHFPSTPVLLAVRKNKDSDEIEHLSLRTLIETRCQSLFKEFNPLWWLFNGHLQTIYCVMGDFSKYDLMWYDRQYLRLTDGGTLGIDFAPVDASHLKDDAPIVVVQHGLTGGSYEPYVRAILSRACAPVGKGGLGYRAVIINFRGCAGVPITSPVLYSAGNTDDTRQALYYISSKYPKARLLGLGFSLGSNVMTRYLAEEGYNSRIDAACALACPWDLDHNNTRLLSTFLGRNIYSKGMGGNLVNLLKKHAKAFLGDPEKEYAQACTQALDLKSPTLETFDNVFTRIAGGPAPHFPFETAHHYYQWGSSHNAVKDVKVPFLAINASDDPVVRHVPMDGGGNGLVVMELTTGGGHLGWFQPGPGSSVDRWTTQPVLQWLKLVGEEVLDNPEIKRKSLYVDDNGFLKEEGRPYLGCKPTEGGGVIDGNGGEEGTLQGL